MHRTSQQNPTMATGNKKLTIAEVGSKLRSKRDLYNFAYSQLDRHLPPYESINVKYLVALLKPNGKLAVTHNEINRKSAPRYQLLRVKELLTFALNNGLKDYIPDKDQCTRYDRDYLISICQTKAADAFQQLVAQADDISIANAAKNNVGQEQVEFTDEVIQALQSMNRVSSHKSGTAYFSLVYRKPKKPKPQEDDAAMASVNASPMRNELVVTKAKLEAMTPHRQFQGVTQLLGKMANDGKIDEEGKQELNLWYAQYDETEASTLPDKSGSMEDAFKDEKTDQ